MKILDPQFNPQQFWENVRKASERALLLDYDGTLAPFKVQRDQAFPYPGVRDLLDTIIASGKSRVILISGRNIKDLLPLLGLAKTPEIWGAHGWERLKTDGVREVEPLNPELKCIFKEAKRWIESIGLANRCEQKHAALAVHWRGQDSGSIENIRQKLLHEWEKYGDEKKVFLHEFDGGMELRAFGRNKGYVVNRILSELNPGMAATYLGDDFTDEDAFQAIKGKGCSILVRSELRETIADLWLKPPEELLCFLSEWNDSLRVERYKP